MKWSYGFSPAVDQELAEALSYYFAWKPEKGITDFFQLVDASFSTALTYPEATPFSNVTGVPHTLRRVNVWHFAFLYRVDEEAKLLIVERIFHERSEASQ